MTDFTNPITWPTGLDVTDAILNQQVRDNMLALHNGEGCLLGQTAAQTGLIGGANVPVKWDSEQSDTNTLHDIVTNNHLVTVKRAGVYICHANLALNNHTVGLHDFVVIYKNGSIIVSIGDLPIPDAIAINRFSISGEVLLAANDTLQVNVNPGANKDLNWVSIYWPNFSVRWVRPA